MQISSLDYSSYVGTIGIGRISRGQIKAKSSVKLLIKKGLFVPALVTIIWF